MATAITRTKSPTNEKPKSCAPASVNVRSCLDFDAMWSAHPLNWKPTPEAHPFRHPPPPNPFAVLTDASPVLGKPVYPDQCAIKLSFALQAGGLPFDTYPKPRSEVREVARLKRKMRGALAAEELAQWLSKALGLPEKYKDADALAKVKGKRGIIFFKDFWQRDGERGVQGDHIDLGDGTNTPNFPVETHTSNSSYFTRSASVWFWELK